MKGTIWNPIPRCFWCERLVPKGALVDLRSGRVKCLECSEYDGGQALLPLQPDADSGTLVAPPNVAGEEDT